MYPVTARVVHISGQQPVVGRSPLTPTTWEGGAADWPNLLQYVSVPWNGIYMAARSKSTSSRLTSTPQCLPVPNCLKQKPNLNLLGTVTVPFLMDAVHKVVDKITLRDENGNTVSQWYNEDVSVSRHCLSRIQCVTCRLTVLNQIRPIPPHRRTWTALTYFSYQSGVGIIIVTWSTGASLLGLGLVCVRPCGFSCRHGMGLVLTRRRMPGKPSLMSSSGTSASVV